MAARGGAGFGGAFGAVLLLFLGLALSSCGGSSPSLTVSIAAGETPEELVLANVYAQALERAGYKVKAKIRTDLFPEELPQALSHGQISGFVDHLTTAIPVFAGKLPYEVPPDAGRGYRMLQTALRRRRMVAFPPTPFELTNFVGALRATAARHNLEKVSDLEGQAEQFTITGFTGCHEAPNCVEGLERFYGLHFGGFIYRAATPSEPFRDLETRFAELAMLPSTDGRLLTESKRFATLEEDRHLFPAGNAVFITSPHVVAAAGPGFESAIVAAQKGLTLRVMQELDAEVQLEKRTPAAVAAKYLESAEG